MALKCPHEFGDVLLPREQAGFVGQQVIARASDQGSDDEERPLLSTLDNYLLFSCRVIALLPYKGAITSDNILSFDETGAR